MSYDLDPIVGNWYQRVDTGLDFEVVALDEDAASVEIQYLDGAIDEISLDEWYELDLEAAEAPEDWTESLDSAETGDTDFSEAEPQEGWEEEPPARGSRRSRPGEGDDLEPDEFGGDWEE